MVSLNTVPNRTVLNESHPVTEASQDEEAGTVYKHLGLVCSLAMIIVSVIGAIGNGYAVWHFGRPSSRSSVNILLTALSTFDLILLITGAPIYSLLGIYSYDGSHVYLLALGYCTMVLYPFSHMAQMGSVWTMMVISFERYLGVCHPFMARRELTTERARICVIFVALLSIGYNLCRFWEFGMNAAGLPDPILRADPTYVSVYFHWMYFAFLFSIPFLVIFVFNMLVVFGVRKATLNRPRCQINVQQCGERKTTMMLLVVVAVFFACNSLAWLLNGYEMLGYQGSEAAFEFLSDLNNLLILAHPTFNILVYASFSSKFRSDFFYFLCRYLHSSVITTPQSSIARGDQKGCPSSRRVSYAILNGSCARLSCDQGEQTVHCLRKKTINALDTANSGPLSPSPTAPTMGMQYLRVPWNGTTHESDAKRHLLVALRYAETSIGQRPCEATDV